jgi:RHS repeat-associated protein
MEHATRKFVWRGQEQGEWSRWEASDIDGKGEGPSERERASQFIGTTGYTFMRDHLGSIRELIKTDGKTLGVRLDYDPYGRQTTVSGTAAADFGFTGLYRHSASGLNFATYRAYDPDLGRWVNRDPIEEEGGLNLYSYVENNSLNAIDPMGLDEEYRGARVTAYGFGKDNAYRGHPEGGDAVASTQDRSRIERVAPKEYVAHAVLGDGTFAHPSSLAVHPDAGIAPYSKVYIKGVGWFIVEDVCSSRMSRDTFDLWTGRSNSQARALLSGARDVTVYGPRETVPEKKRTQGPGAIRNFMPRGNSRSAYPH